MSTFYARSASKDQLLTLLSFLVLWREEMSYCECEFDECPRTTILLFGSLSQATNCEISPPTTTLLFGCETSRATYCEISPPTYDTVIRLQPRATNCEIRFPEMDGKIDRQNETLDATQDR